MAKVQLEDNSFASRENERRVEREEREQVEKVITGTAIKKKKTVGRKIVDTILSEKIDKIEDYVKYEVLGPGVKNLLYDMVMGALSMAFFGEVRRGSRSRSESDRPRRVPYDDMYDERRDSSRYRSRRPSYQPDEILFKTRDDAEKVLDELERIIGRFNTARVADFNSLAGVTGTWTDENYGWNDLRGVRVIPTPEGYIIDFPPCIDVR